MMGILMSDDQLMAECLAIYWFAGGLARQALALFLPGS